MDTQAGPAAAGLGPLLVVLASRHRAGVSVSLPGFPRLDFTYR